jgi:hypothetical protein
MDAPLATRLVVVVMMMMMVVMVMPPAMMMVMRVAASDLDRNLRDLCFRKPCIVGLQKWHSVRNRIEQIAVVRRRREFRRLRWRRLGARHCGQGCSRSQQTG